MDIKKALRQIRSGRFEEMEIKRHREALERKRLAGGAGYDKEKVLTSPSDKIADITAEIDAIDEKLRDHSERILAKESACLDAITKVEESIYRRILMLRYIDDEPKSWMEIAYTIGYSEVHTKKMHGLALKEARKHWKEDTL